MREFINWETIVVRGNKTGVKKTTCPLCSESRKKKKDPCLYVNFNSGVAKCYNCNALGFRESNEPKPEARTYTLPKQDWNNYSELSDKMVKWIEGERKIHQSTLIDLCITEETYYQPKHQKETNNIVFNYFEGEKLVNKKYRSGSKAFTQSTGGKSIFYNINSIIGEKKCYIVEGEFDVLAMHDHGIKNVVSVPNGANDNDEYWINSEPYLKDIEKFIIATDNDEKGNELKERIAQRLGRYRCEFIEWSAKDANGGLIDGTISTDLASVQRFPVSGTFKVEDLYDDILGLYDNGLPSTISPKHESFGNLKNIFSTMRGHLITGTGIPSHGKSNWTEWYVLNLCNDHNMKASFFSPEHAPMELHQTTFIQKVIGKNFWREVEGVPRIDKEDIARYKDWANEKVYLTGTEKGETPNWDWLLERFKEQMFTYGIDIFVIDAFNKVELPTGNKLDSINTVLTKLTNFAQANNVMVFLVAHPTKMKKNESGVYDNPTLYDVSGSADFRNQTHDGFSVYRYFEDDVSGQEAYTTFYNLKTKFSFQGEIGATVDYDYHLPSGRYYERHSGYQPWDFTRERILEPVQTAMQPNTSFDLDDINDDEIPF